MREFRSVRKRPGSSPPSPEFDWAWSRLNAIATVSWASAESEPCDMAPLEKRAEKKTETDDGAAAEPSSQPPTGGETIGDAIAAKGSAPQAASEAPTQ